MISLNEQAQRAKDAIEDNSNGVVQSTSIGEVLAAEPMVTECEKLLALIGPITLGLENLARTWEALCDSRNGDILFRVILKDEAEGVAVVLREAGHRRVAGKIMLRWHENTTGVAEYMSETERATWFAMAEED